MQASTIATATATVIPIFYSLTTSIAMPTEAGIEPKMYDIFHSFDKRSRANSSMVTPVCDLSVIHRLHALMNPKIKVIRKIVIPNIIRVFAIFLYEFFIVFRETKALKTSAFEYVSITYKPLR